MANKADIRIIVGAEYTATKDQLVKDLEQITKEISDSGILKVKIDVDDTFLNKLKSTLEGIKLEPTGEKIGTNLAQGMSTAIQDVSMNIQNQISGLLGKIETKSIEIPLDFKQYTGEKLGEIFSRISSDIQQQTGNLPKISISEIFTDDGVETTRASVQYINKELGTTVKTFYDIKTAEDGTITATESLRNSIINTGSSLKEINVDFERAFAAERIKTLQAQTAGLNVDFTKLTDLSKNIVDVTTLENYKNELKLVQEQIRAMKASIQSEVKFDPIAAMHNKLLIMPQAIEVVQNRLQKLADVKGFDEVNAKAKILNDLLAEISKPKEDELLKTAEEQLQAFEKLRQKLVEVNADIKVLSSRKAIDVSGEFIPKFEGQLDPSQIENWQRKVNEASVSLNMLGGNTENTTRILTSLNETMGTLKGAENIQEQTTAIVGLRETVKQANAEFKRMQIIPPDARSKVIELRTTMEAWLTNNTAAVGKFGDRIKQLIDQLNDPRLTKGQFQEIGTQFRIARKEADSLGLTTSSLTDKLGKMISKFAEWYSITRILMEVVRLFKQMISNVIELDTQMTEIVKLTGLAGNAYNKFLDDATVRAKNLNVSISDVIKSTADFMRMGLGISEAKEAADAALVFKNVAYGINDVSEASSYMISVLKGFSIEASRSMEIVDKFTKVGNKFALTSQDLGEGMKNAGAALAGANNTIDESAGLLVAANNAMQDMSKASKMMLDNIVIYYKKIAI